MADTYAYRVRDPKGGLVTGELQADSRDLVLSRLREQGFIPLEIKVKKGSSAGLKMEINFLTKQKVKLKSLAIFSRQFATMINSGLPLLRALAILEQQTDAKQLAKVIGAVRLDVEQGSALSQAMAKHPKAFSRLYISMIKAGETGGVLDSVLLRLADTIEREVELRRRVKSAMTYPIVVMIIVSLIFVAMMLLVVPTFKGLFQSLGGTLPLPTRILLFMSALLQKYFLIIIALFVGFIIGLRRWIKTDKGRLWFDKLKLKIPVFGPLFHKTAMSRFARTLGVLSRSGVPLLQSLDIVQETVNNQLVANAVKDLQESVKEGESLSAPLARHAVFPPMVVQMLAVGEETGALDTMLEKIAEFYDQEVTATVDALTALIEPLLIVFVGGAVGGIVLALYLPMFRIFDLIR